MPKQILDSSNDIWDQAQQSLNSTTSIHCLATYYKVSTVQVYKQGQMDIRSCQKMVYIPGMIVCLNHMMEQWAWEDFAEFENNKVSQAIATLTIYVYGSDKLLLLSAGH